MLKGMKTGIVTGIVCLMMQTIPLVASIQSVSIRGGVEKLEGHSTYQIGFPVTDSSGTYRGYFPFSELRFPLHVYMAVLDITVITEKFKIEAGYKRNITRDTGYMEDSDWITPEDTGRLDIYSESKTKFTGNNGSLSVFYSVMQRDSFLLYFGAGLIYQDYAFESFDTDQWYPSQPSLPHDYVPGKTITYDVTFYIPYLGLHATCNPLAQLHLGATLGISPRTVAKDRDVHLARDPVIIAEGDYTGFSFILGMEADYYISDTIFFHAKIEYLSIDVSGEQYNTEDSDWWETRAEIKSAQLALSVSAGYRI